MASDDQDSKHKLNPGTSASQNSKMMTLRRRTRGAHQQQLPLGGGDKYRDELAYEQTTILVPQRPIYLLTNEQEQAANNATGGLPPQEQQQSKPASPDRIFSITQFATTSTILLVGLLSYIVILGLFSLNMRSPTMLVNAQYSIHDSTSNNAKAADSSAGRRSHHNNRSPPPTSSSSIDRYDSGGGEQIRAPLLPKTTTLPPLVGKYDNSRQRGMDQVTAGGMQLAASKSHDSYMSPEERDQLLRNQERHYEGANGPPSDHSNRADYPRSSSAAGQYADQDSGVSSAGATGGNGPMASGGGSSNNYRPALEASGSNNQNSEEEEADDEDGPDEGPSGAAPAPGAGQSPGAYAGHSSPHSSYSTMNQVPENRRPMEGNTYNRRQSAPFGDESNVNNEDITGGDPVGGGGGSDEYGAGAGNDDEYFSRKPGGNQPALKLAASDNRNNRNYLAEDRRGQDRPLGNILYNSAPSHYKGGLESGNGNPRESDESQGFGPGPNEAYLAERAEAAAAAAASRDGHPDAGENSDPADVDPESNMDEPPMDQSVPPIDRRSNEQQSDSDNMAGGGGGDGNDVGPLMGEGSPGPMATRGDASGPESADSVQDSSDDSGGDSETNDSFASSTHSDPRKSQATGYNARNVQAPGLMVPRTSAASAPAPLAAALRPNTLVGSKFPPAAPGGAATGGSPPMLDPREALKLKQQAASQWHHERLINNPHLLSSKKLDHYSGSSNRFSPIEDAKRPVDERHQIMMAPKPPAAKVPYNPQDNPSHAGKYFIN